MTLQFSHRVQGFAENKMRIPDKIASMSQRVYKFLSGQYGISNLENRRLKVTTVDDLNDPFDLVAVDLTDDRIEHAVTRTIASFRGDMALLCFSRVWDNLLLWSHYGESHRGICLGFDIPDKQPSGDYSLEVTYQPELLQLARPEDVNYEFMNKLLRTKHQCWSYEQESRLFVQLNDQPDEKGLWWFDFGPALDLKEVIVGALCPRERVQAIAQVLKEQNIGVDCCWAYMRRDAFALVRHNFPPPWF
jgi:hypothetical protein